MIGLITFRLFPTEPFTVRSNMTIGIDVFAMLAQNLIFAKLAPHSSLHIALGVTLFWY